MKYKIQQKLLTSAEDFTIKNENDEDIFYVREKSLPKGLYLCLEDTEGNVLYYFEQQIFRLLPEYYIYDSADKKVSSIKKEFSFFVPKYKIESDYGNYSLSGDLVYHNFSIMKDNLQCAAVGKKTFSKFSVFEADIDESDNAYFILSLVIIIDMITDNTERSSC